MTVYQMALTSLCEFVGCVLLIIGYVKQDKLIRFERGFIRVAAVYVAVYKSWRKERRNERIKKAAGAGTLNNFLLWQSGEFDKKTR